MLAMHTHSLRRVFKGLGTTIELRVWPQTGREQLAAGSLAHAARFLRQAEARLSRFDPEAELSRLNRGTRTPRRVSRLTFAVIRAALSAAEATDGLFDPTILQALLAAGYDRSFDKLRDRSGSSGSLVNAEAPLCGQWRAIRLDSAARTVWLPPGVGLDLGGIAKGWLADRVLEGLRRAGPTPTLAVISPSLLRARARTTGGSRSKIPAQRKAPPRSCGWREAVWLRRASHGAPGPLAASCGTI